MKAATAQQVAVIACVLLAYLCLTLMDSYPDYSRPQDLLQAAGYVLCGAALYFFFKILTGKRV